MTTPETTSDVLAANLTVSELEALIRRVVREELSQLLQTVPSVVADWSHEGPDDAEDDEVLLQEVLVEIAREKLSSLDASERISLEAFRVELARAEAAGELPD